MKELKLKVQSDLIQKYIHIIVSNDKDAVPKSYIPLDTGRKLNAHKTFRRRPGRLLNILYTFDLRPASGVMATITQNKHVPFFICLLRKLRKSERGE